MRNVFRAGLAAAVLLGGAGCVDGGKPATETFLWRGPVAEGAWLKVRNLDGDLEIRASDDDSASVMLDIDRSNAYAPSATVKLVKDGNDIIACVLYGNDGTCSAGRYDGGRSAGYAFLPFLRGNTAVHGTIRVPRGVRLDLGTTNGDLDIDGVDADLVVRGVNGDVELRGVRHAAQVTTTNGDVSVSAESVGSGVQVHTTNGDVTVSVPSTLAAALSMQTVNGELTVGFPVSYTTQTAKSIVATLGGGGSPVKLETTNGDITLRAPGR